MTKLNLPLALTMATLAHTTPPATAQSTCTYTGTIATITGAAGDCNYAKFAASLAATNRCTLAQLFPNVAQATIESTINDMCKYDGPTQFVEIQGTWQLDRRYMHGEGPFIDSLESFNVERGRVLRFNDNVASKTLIAWPEYAALYEYNKQTLGGVNGAHGMPYNFDTVNSCKLNTAMCCFIDVDESVNNGQFHVNDGMTDVCRNDLSHSRNHINKGWSVFQNSETPTHCVGFSWTPDTMTDVFKGNALYDVSLRNTATKGYVKSIPGAPLCGCMEHMPTVAKADCRTITNVGDVTYTFHHDGITKEISAGNTVDVTYGACAEGDLASHYKAKHDGDAAAQALMDEYLVGEGGCNQDEIDYLNDEHFLKKGTHASKFKTIPEDKWVQVVGEGIRFLPPQIDPIAADTDFRALVVDGGCTKSDGSGRMCIIRRFCDTCTQESHRDIYYKRIKPLPPMGTNSTNGELYFLDLFMNNWFNAPANVLNTDFELYSTYEDALAGTNKWTYCNYNDRGVGFPRDCGPTGWVGDQWNSYVRGGGTANHHAFYVEIA